MKTRHFALFILSIGIGLTPGLSACGPSAPVSDEVSTAPTVADETVAMTPEQIVENFYTWYLGYIGEPGSRQMRDPLADGVYRSNECLTDAFIQQVDEALLSSGRTTYDPFLCTPGVPHYISVDNAVIIGDEANVVVHEIWYGGTIMLDVKVNLQRVNGQWKIASIAPVQT